MEVRKDYNKLLDKLFDQWQGSYNEYERKKFCKDGLMLKADYTFDVNDMWDNAPRRIMFLLKDNPDDGQDTRLWLIDEKNGEKNRNLRNRFVKRLAQMFYGLLECKPDNHVNDKYVNSRKMMDDIRKAWNQKPFAFVEAKKIAGGKTISEKTLKDTLQRDKNYLIQEFSILHPNIIVCCDGCGDALFEFVTQDYLKNRGYEEYGGDYPNVPNLKTCLRYYKSEGIVVIKSYHPSAIVGWKVFEKVFSPYREFINEHRIF